MRTLLFCVAVVIAFACADPSGPVTVRLPIAAPDAPSFALRTAEAPVVLSAEVVGQSKGWNIVRVTFQDNAEDERWNVAAYRDADGKWMFVTWSTDGILGTGERSVEFRAPKKAAFVQVQAMWSNADISGYSNIVPIN